MLCQAGEFILCYGMLGKYITATARDSFGSLGFGWRFFAVFDGNHILKLGLKKISAILR